jgi:hypothetical protein
MEMKTATQRKLLTIQLIMGRRLINNVIYSGAQITN